VFFAMVDLLFVFDYEYSVVVDAVEVSSQLSLNEIRDMGFQKSGINRGQTTITSYPSAKICVAAPVMIVRNSLNITYVLSYALARRSLINK